MQTRTPFTGCGTALVTPFTSSGDVDEPAVRRLARRQVEAGVHFLVPCGTTGEAPTLSAAERRRVVELVVDEVAGRVPVLAGAGGYDTHEVGEAARAMQAAGASACTATTRRSRRRHRCRSSSTTCRAVPAATWTRTRSRGSRRSRTWWG
jgi:dihydrodipicolinate synthase/N-acetylneuraminate lyase